MKLYVDRGGTAPSPRRVRIFLAEKGIEIPYERLELHKENRTKEFREKNPFSTLPVLELDDGTCLSESIAICRYFEELYPTPPLFGTGALDKARVEMWMRRVELYVYLPIDLSGDDFLPGEAPTTFRGFAHKSFRFLDRVLREREFIGGDRYTIADVFALSAIDFGKNCMGYSIETEQASLQRWYETVSARPSARA